MKYLKYMFAGLAGAVLLSGCQTTIRLPESGVATKFDGHWEGDLLSSRNLCDGLTVDFEVRYGHYSGNLYSRGARISDFWGEVLPNGKLVARGKRGISDGSSNIFFTENTADGTWKSSSCDGTADFRKLKT